jgi:NhaA family Na+:H+ antiporter
MKRPVSDSEPVDAPLEKPTRALAEPFLDFINAQSASAWVLMAALLLAAAAANSTLAPMYFGLLHVEFGVVLGDSGISMSLQHWVNDGLMALFFFLLGIELKREVLVGRLSELRRANSVLCAAIGGIAIPALLFFLLGDTPAIRRGWAVPVATDTAFALAILVLLGDRVPATARAFLVGLAIVDDVGAILIIAIAYTTEFDTSVLIPVLINVGVLIGMNLAGVRSGLPYLLAGIVLWFLFAQFGLHGTLAGMVTALVAPVRPALARPAFARLLRQKVRRFEEVHDEETDSILEQPKQQAIAQDVLRVARKATVSLSRWESRLENPVSFIVMPLFAFMNAGVVLSGDTVGAALASSLSAAIFFGLLVGKPVGILLGIWVGKILGIASIPAPLTWGHVVGIGLLGGIGFTMSLFISNLSFGEGSALLEIAKQTIIFASLCAGLLGYAWLRWGTPSRQ